MGDELSRERARGKVTTYLWEARCKDCEAEQKAKQQGAQSLKISGTRARAESRTVESQQFEYSDSWAIRTDERGNTRSDRCERHRREHREVIQAIAVPYIDLQTIGEVTDRENPTGPLGGVGPLPVLHKKRPRNVDLDSFKFGMTDNDIHKILEGLKQKKIAVVEAGTGTGKSTFMPFRLMNPPPGANLRVTDFGPIVVTEPRRAAAKALAHYVGEQMVNGHDHRICSEHFGPGFPVGYQIGGEKYWDSACDLIYVTDGTMINWAKQGRLAEIGTVIVDEAHERSEEIEIVLAQLNEQVQIHDHLRVIITSATIDKDLFVEYFGGDENVFHCKFEAPKSFGYGVPFFIHTEIDDEKIEKGATVNFDGELVTTGEDDLKGDNEQLQFDGWKERGPEEEDYEVENLRGTTRELQDLRCGEELAIEECKERIPKSVEEVVSGVVARQVLKIAAGTQYGDILAFLPTRILIQRSVDLVIKGLAANGLDCDVYALLASQPDDIIRKALAARKRGQKRKIVVSSNLAETSMTVEGVRYIVDSGLICQSDWDPEFGNKFYPTRAHSQSGLRQRWGRVGRDAPGWIFPLYTINQFLSLPKDTLPETARINLETSCMKMLAAGIDPGSTKLLGGFASESVRSDDNAIEVADAVNRELKRAATALAKCGAVDGEGQLTEFGRELERFPLSGVQAVAVMLADQLACVHEVALVLVALCKGKLQGKRDDTVLYVDRDWPAAWRVRAARCHRALAIGCRDDLDVLLRIFSIWQKSDDKDVWCAIWWLNQEALKQLQKDADKIIVSLSSGMKGKAARNANPDLADRARAVITHAMGDLRYGSSKSGEFVGRFGADGNKAKLSLNSVLPDPPDEIIALSRFSPSATADGDRKAIISNIIGVLEWAERGDLEPDNMGFDLAIKVADHLKDSDGLEKFNADLLSGIRQAYSVGSLVDIVIGAWKKTGTPVKEIKLVSGPFEYPVGSGMVGSGDPEIERDVDRNPNPNALLPPEEAARQLVDPESVEANDSGGESPAEKSQPDTKPTSPVRNGDLPNLIVVPRHDNVELRESCRVEIVGYELRNNTTAALVVEPVVADARQKDPAVHHDLEYGQEIEVEVRGIVKDAEFELTQLARTDGKGSFYLNDRAPGLFYYDQDFSKRLVPGAQFTAQMVPGDKTERYSVTLLPSCLEHVAFGSAEQKRRKGELQKYWPATLIDGANDYGKVTIELDHRDDERGLLYRFEVNASQLDRQEHLSRDVGQKLLVAFDTNRYSKRKLRCPDSAAIQAVVDKHSDYLSFEREEISFRGFVLPKDVVGDLLAIDNAGGWEREVWRFFVDSHFQAVDNVLPVLARRKLKASKLVRSIPEVWGVENKFINSFDGVHLSLDRVSDEIEVSGVDNEKINSAIESLENTIRLPRIVGIIPSDNVGAVIGDKGQFIKSIEERDNILWIWVNGNTVTVIGKTTNAVNEAIKAIRSKSDRPGESKKLKIIENTTRQLDSKKTKFKKPERTYRTNYGSRAAPNTHERLKSTEHIPHRQTNASLSGFLIAVSVLLTGIVIIIALFWTDNLRLNSMKAFGPPSIKWEITSKYPNNLYLSFRSRNRVHEWPGEGKVWVLKYLSTNIFDLACNEGEKICYGAWPERSGWSERGLYWGCGRNCQQACKKCCIFCEAGRKVQTTLVP